MLTTTLRSIRACDLHDVAQKLRNHLGQAWNEDAPIPYTTILKATDLNDALWCARAEPQHSKVWRLLAVQYARDVQPADADPRSLRALDVAEQHARRQVTGDELADARGAARNAADSIRGLKNYGMEAAWIAARPYAWAAVRDTALAAARAAACEAANTASAAANTVEGPASRATAGYAAWDAAWSTARDAAIKRQTEQFITAVS